MANPILSRSENFASARPQHNPYQGYAGYQQGYDQYGQPQQYAPEQHLPQPPTATMTLDDVIAKSALSLGVVGATALVGAMFVPGNILMLAAIGSALAAMVMGFVLSSRRVVPPAGVIAFAALEGIFVGGISAMLESMFPGIVVTAVIATFATAAVTLAAYKFFNIRVSTKFRKIVTIGMFSLAALYLTNFVFSLFGNSLGVVQWGPGAGGLSMIVSAVAVVLAVMSLITDFDMVERGVANRAPATESWRAALGITATMVFLYIEILRITSYFRN